jgi:hypothetical protein
LRVELQIARELAAERAHAVKLHTSQAPRQKGQRKRRP